MLNKCPLTQTFSTPQSVGLHPLMPLLARDESRKVTCKNYKEREAKTELSVEMPSNIIKLEYSPCSFYLLIFSQADRASAFQLTIANANTM